MQELLERAFVEPYHRLGAQFESVLPAAMTVAVILAAGWLTAHFLRRGLYWLLVRMHFDRVAGHTGFAGTVERTRLFHSPSDFAARLVQGGVWLLTMLLALNAAGSQMTEELVVRFVRYVPDLITAALVLLLGSVVSKFLARSALLAAVNAQWPGARMVAGGVRVLVMSLAVVVALEQLRIGRTALLVSFAILFAGIIMAGAIAFGWGARELAREWLQSRLRPHEPEEDEVLRHL